jgi:hypothetical protein
MPHHGKAAAFHSSSSPSTRQLLAVALTVATAWPATRPTLTLFQLLSGPTDAPFPSHLLLGVFDPADELVARQWRDVRPGTECRGVVDQRLAQVSWKFVNNATGYLTASHELRVAELIRAPPLRTRCSELSSWHRRNTRSRLRSRATSLGSLTTRRRQRGLRCPPRGPDPAVVTICYTGSAPPLPRPCW